MNTTLGLFSIVAEDITVVSSNQLPSEEEEIESPARETGRFPQKFYTAAETLIMSVTKTSRDLH